MGALERAINDLRRQQAADGSFEGEVIWCAMLAAQYAIMCHITGTKISEERRRRLILQFERTQLPSGLWGLHDHSEPYLFTTTLVYVAARLHGVEASDPMLRSAREFFEREDGVVEIPSWGKFWLAMLGLYDWSGVNAVLPEAWLLPKRFPLHPSKFYCHTRLIYMGLATVYGRKVVAPRTAIIDALRTELYPGGYASVDFPGARDRLREEEIFTPPSAALKLVYRASALAERLHRPAQRGKILTDLYRRIRWEFRSTDYTCLSPVNGLLNMIALYAHDPNDADFKRALARFEGWIWEDDRDGLRVAGARSASWDTAFAVQALSAAAPHVDVQEELERAVAFLRSQQIRSPQAAGYADNYRIDPTGGWCFAGIWHGWPVSDCTAEAIEAIMKASPWTREPIEDQNEIEAGVRFMLRCQNPEGGFGSYEARKAWIGLEWINPAEMFGDSMTEHSYIECTASNLSALALFRDRYPASSLRAQVDRAIDRALRFLRKMQRGDGAFSGCWGVHFTYGTLFAIRGLRAAGVSPHDPAIQRACDWLVSHQRSDGGWGEHHQAALMDRYVEHEQSQFVQTAWALMALVEADAPHTSVIERGARFLERSQTDEGSYPRQDMAGVFFHTALLEYALYRRYFPAWALGTVESRRKARRVRAAELNKGIAGAEVAFPGSNEETRAVHP